MHAENLTLSNEEMRALGYRVVDMLVHHFSALPGKPVTRKASRAQMESVLSRSIPAEGNDPLEVLETLQEHIFSNIMHLDHPRFFAFVPSPSNFAGVMADTLASGFNVFAGTWLEASGPAMIELQTLDWLRQICGLPGTAGGLFTSGGSMANLTALAVARHVKLGSPRSEGVVYCSDQTHSSIARAMRLLGFHDGQLRILASDPRQRLDVDRLAEAVRGDGSIGLRPFCVVASAGTTNSGAVDPLPELADFCRREDLWLHVDGAYGAAAMLSPRSRSLLRGIEQADSLTIDPHKWLFQPYEIGCLLVRHEEWLKEVFHILPEYLADIETRHGEVNFCDRGVQLTRSFRALKLWFSLQVFGADAFSQAIEYGIGLAEYAETCLRAMPGWRAVTPAQLGILTFAYTGSGLTGKRLENLHQEIVQALIADRYAFLSTTNLGGRSVLRMCTINPRASRGDIKGTLEKVDRLAQAIHSA